MFCFPMTLSDLEGSFNIQKAPQGKYVDNDTRVAH